MKKGLKHFMRNLLAKEIGSQKQIASFATSALKLVCCKPLKVWKKKRGGGNLNEFKSILEYATWAPKYKKKSTKIAHFLYSFRGSKRTEHVTVATFNDVL